VTSTVQGQGAGLAIQLARERPFRLGAVEVRPATREVVGPDGREVLEPRVMQVLVALARAGGEIVSREDLTESCWDGRIVGDDAINRVLSRLRRLSEGVGREGWRLETITKVGYRLVEAGAADEPAVRPAPPVMASRRLLFLAGGGVAAFTAIGGAAAWWIGRPHVSAEARTLYEKGREALRQGQMEPNAQAIGFLRAAVAEQADYADAWGVLAQAYQQSLTFTEPARQAGVRAQAQAAAKRAMELDPNQPDAAAALALLAPTYRNWAKAEDLYVRALALHPGDPVVELGYNKLLLNVGRIKAGLTAAETGLRGDAYSPYHHFAYGTTLWMLGRTEEAEAAARKALALWPRHLAIWFLLFHILAYGGRGDEALSMGANIDGRPASVPAQDIELSLLGARALMTRDAGDVAAATKANLEAAPRGVGFAENAIQWLASMGRLDDAYAVARGLFLDQGFSIGSQRYSEAQSRFMPGRSRSTYPLFMPSNVSLRADPRFPALVRDIGLAEYWKLPGRGPDDPTWLRGG
jgi:DNA-binding winged helix-turn-helix (wHTH) protein/tetratricopeptide (TPR) repeat protein